jgi:urease accessory protein
MVRICPEHGNSADLIRAAYHLGNRHVALDIRPDRLLLEPDPVLAALLRRMHLTVAEVDAPFEPEGGAYGPAHAAANAAPSEHGGGGLGSKQHSSHDHSDHDHSGDDHSGDGYSSHDHSGHEHGRREHSGHKHGGHKH